MLWFLRIAFTVVGVGLLIFAKTMPAFVDEDSFENRVDELWQDSAATDINSLNQEFYALCDTHLTAKYRLLDYGISCLFYATLFLIFKFWGVQKFADLKRLKSPQSIFVIRVLGVTAAIMMTFFTGIHTLLAASRSIFPPWEDFADIISTFGALFWCGVLICLSLLFSTLPRFTRPLDSAVLIGIFGRSTSPSIGWWIVFGFPLSICAILIILSTFNGAWTMMIPFWSWFVFFLLLLAGKQRQPKTDAE